MAREWSIKRAASVVVNRSYTIMIYIRISLILTFLVISVVTHGVTTQEIRLAIDSEFVKTKFSLTGKMKRVGTVLVVKREGMFAIKQKLSMPKTEFVDGGLVSGTGPSASTKRWPLRKGDRLYLQGYTVHNDGLILQLVTDAIYDTGMRKPRSVHLHLRMTYSSGISGITAEDLLGDISELLLAKDKVAAIPELLEANKHAEKSPIKPIVPTVLSSARTAQVQQRSSSNSSRTVSSRSNSIENEEEIISCAESEWDGVVSNIADLFECDKLRAIQSLSTGRELEFKLDKVSFSGGKFIAKHYTRATWFDVLWQRATAQGGMKEFNAKNYLQQRKPSYTVECSFSPDSLSGLKEGDSTLIEAKLTDFVEKSSFSANRLLLDCVSLR